MHNNIKLQPCSLVRDDIEFSFDNDKHATFKLRTKLWTHNSGVF